jgi:hypothetical protein
MTGGARILIIDDETPIRRFLCVAIRWSRLPAPGQELMPPRLKILPP